MASAFSLEGVVDDVDVEERDLHPELGWALTERSRILAYARRLVPTPEDAEEVFYTALWKAHTSLASGNKQPGRMRSWFYRIVHNTAVSSRRKTRREETLLEDADRVADSSSPPDEYVAQRELGVALQMAMDQLPPAQREAVGLRYLRELDHEDIATRAGIEVGTVKTRIHRAKDHLRRILQDQFPELVYNP